MAAFDVTTNNDSGAGSLRAAIVAANQSAGSDTITFHIPSTGGIVPFIFSFTQLPEITGPTVIDATTQPEYTGARPVVQLPGDMAGAGASGLRFSNAGRCEVRGLLINRWAGSGIRVTGATTAVIEKNWIGLHPDGTATGTFGNGVGIYTSSSGGTIGGATAAARNVISGNRTDGILIDGGRQNVVRFNYIGTLPTGAGSYPNVNAGLAVQGPAGSDAANVIEDNVISGNGTGVSIVRSAANVLRRNTIGLRSTGSSAIPNTGDGILITGVGAVRNVIGGEGLAADVGNFIAGNNGNGINLSTSSSATLVQGNKFGFAINQFGGTIFVGNKANGILIDSNDNSVVSNEVVFSTIDGVRVVGGANNALRRNLIGGNGMPINLGTDGATPNDVGDADTGPNGLQNSPVITGIVSDGTETTVTGTINSRPGFSYEIELYHRLGSPPGYVYRQSTTVPVDAAGNGAFMIVMPQLQAGVSLTATATRLTAGGGETSEFSAAIPAPPIIDNRGPQVSGVFVAGSAWSDTFLQHLENTGRGERLYGFSLPAGAAQHAPLPWVNVNKISIRFNEHAVVHQDDLVIHAAVGDGAAPGGRYATSAFSYSGNTRTATWTLRSPIRADRLTLELNADGATGVKDAAGNALDGEWINGSSAFPSGNRAPGEDFRFAFNVVPGDVTRNNGVNIIDEAQVRRRFGASLDAAGAPTARYSLFADLDGNGRINAIDVSIVRARQRRALPPA
jgi:parallel beta-helix repeat protein